MGFIGAGKIGGALIKSIIENKIIPPTNIHVTVKNKDRLDVLKDELGLQVYMDTISLAKSSDIIFLAVKPQDMSEVLDELKIVVKSNTYLVVSVAAGISIKYIEEYLGADVPIVRLMPNTPCLIGEGVVAVATSKKVSKNNLQKVFDIISPMGLVITLEEKHMNAITGLSGSGPGFAYKVIESLADGGVEAGLPKQLALKIATQTVLGAAKMLQETKEHPGVLKDMVMSPGGTTSAGLLEMEKQGVSYGLSKAVIAATKRSEELGK